MSETRTDWLRTCGSVLLLLVVGYVLWRVRGVVVTVLLALVMAYVLRPLVEQLCHLQVQLGGRSYRLPRSTAVGVVYLLLGLALWCVWVIGADAVKRQFLEYQTRWPDYHVALMRRATSWENYLRSLPEGMRETANAWVAGLVDAVGQTFQRGLGKTVRSAWMAIEMLLVPILAFYILADGRSIRHQVLFFVPQRYLAWADHALTRSDDAFQKFIRGQVILCLIAFLVVTVGLWAIDLDFYLLLGIVAGITRAIPVIGPLVGAIPILLVLLVAKPLAFAFWVILFFTLLHLMESKLLMPTVLGHQLNLHPVLIIVALLIGAQVAGLLGMFLAPPVLAVIRTLVAERREEEAEPA
jgi:predicted PurR-regulated permease PerM